MLLGKRKELIYFVNLNIKSMCIILFKSIIGPCKEIEQNKCLDYIVYQECFKTIVLFILDILRYIP